MKKPALWRVIIGGMDVSGWVGVGVAVLFGVIAMVQAGKANRRAKNAKQDAKRLDDLVVSISGDVRKIESTAIDARDLAQESNRIASGVLAGVQEAHHVTWDGQWQGHSFRLTNTGDDVANSVRAWVEVDGKRVRESRERVTPGGVVLFDFAGFVNEFCREEAAAQGSRSHVFQSMAFEMTVVEYSVSWVSDLGVAHSHADKCFGCDPEC